MTAYLPPNPSDMSVKRTKPNTTSSIESTARAKEGEDKKVNFIVSLLILLQKKPFHFLFAQECVRCPRLPYASPHTQKSATLTSSVVAIGIFVGMCMRLHLAQLRKRLSSTGEVLPCEGGGESSTLGGEVMDMPLMISSILLQPNRNCVARREGPGAGCSGAGVAADSAGGGSLGPEWE